LREILNECGKNMKTHTTLSVRSRVYSRSRGVDNKGVDVRDEDQTTKEKANPGSNRKGYKWSCLRKGGRDRK
jgi:hypothetical protein